MYVTLKQKRMNLSDAKQVETDGSYIAATNNYIHARL